MKRRYYILIAVFSYLAFTFSYIPAASVISLVQSNFKLPVSISGVSGSLWQGHADTVQIRRPKAKIENISWSLNPLALLMAQASAHVEAQYQQQKVIGNFSIDSSGKLEASEVTSQIKARDFQKLINLPLGELDGQFNLNLASLEWSDINTVPIATGKISWHNAKLTVLEAVDLGNIVIDFKPGKDNSLQISIKNSKGQLAIDGEISVTDKKRYNLDVKIKPNKNATSNITQSLAMFARRQSNGSYQIKRSGDLRQFGL